MTAAERQQVQRRWGVLFQDGALFSSMTVMENILVPLKEHTDLPPPLVDDIAKVKIAMAGLRASADGQYPSGLSGGLRTLAGLARALAPAPDLHFLAEPQGGVAPAG